MEHIKSQPVQKRDRRVKVEYNLDAAFRTQQGTKSRSALQLLEPSVLGTPPAAAAQLQFPTGSVPCHADGFNSVSLCRAPQQPRVPRMPNLYDFQFFNIPRIQELYEKEHAAEQHKHSLQEKESTLKKQVKAI